MNHKKTHHTHTHTVERTLCVGRLGCGDRQTDNMSCLTVQVVKTIPVLPADALLCGSDDINKGVGGGGQ